jgi:uncharacterized DUF497 family protein
MTFEWDDKKNNENNLKHQISFDEAQYAFFDKNRIILKDEKHSIVEDRFFCIGKIEKKIVTVRFTMRRNNIRIIGAGYWREGRKLYERQS